MRKTYTCRRYKSVGYFKYEADFSNAASPIYVCFITGNPNWDDQDKWDPVPFQVADCKHDRREAEKMIARYFK